MVHLDNSLLQYKYHYIRNAATENCLDEQPKWNYCLAGHIPLGVGN